MEENKVVASMLRETKQGRGMRWVFLSITLVVVAGIIAIVAVGFRGRDIQGNSEAMSGATQIPSRDAASP